MVSFISIVFMVVKLKISIFCRSIQLGIPIVPFWGGGGEEGRGFEPLLKLEVVFKQIKLMFE